MSEVNETISAESTETSNNEVDSSNEVVDQDLSLDGLAPDDEQEQGQPNEDLIVPEKFVGKGFEDVLKAHKELESKLGQIGSERAQEKKDRETLEAKYREMERQYEALRGQQTQAAQVPSQQAEVEDPYKLYREEWQEDPETATLNLQRRLRDQDQAKLEQERFDDAAKDQIAYHNKLKQDNPDYARLEPKMGEIYQKYNKLINPKMAASREALDILHLAAKGLDVEYYTKIAIERAKTDSQSVRSEKQAAYSESASSIGSGDKSFKDMSIDEMEKMLADSDDE